MTDYATPLTKSTIDHLTRIVAALVENTGQSQTVICERIGRDRNLISYHTRHPSMTTNKFDAIMGRASGLWDDSKGEWPPDIPRYQPQMPFPGRAADGT